ncbi:hypothetical protein CKJ89_07830 [Klebsiella pneumoniae]|nr:hypothetical protein CKJ89_07830 [Klebsiella pneumoniae]
MFDFHNLHSLSPLRGSHKKNRGIIPLFADCAIPIFLTYIKQSDLETKNRRRGSGLGAGCSPYAYAGLRVL